LHKLELESFSHFQLLTYFSTDLSSDAAVLACRFCTCPDQDIPRSTNGIFVLLKAILAFAQAN
jgi:hypothetical protein